MININEITNCGNDALYKEVKNNTFKSKLIAKNDFIFKQNQQVNEIYWIDNGTFSISFTSTNGRSFNLGRFFEKHRLLGEMELLSGGKAQFDVIALEPTKVTIIPKDHFFNIIMNNSQIALHIMQSFSSRYQETMNQVMNRILHPLIFNVALDIEQRYRNNIQDVNFEKANKEAERFGCTVRAYTRVIKQLIDDGIIIKNNNIIKVIDTEKLSNFLERH